MFESKKSSKEPQVKVIDFGFASYMSTIDSDLL